MAAPKLDQVFNEAATWTSRQAAGFITALFDSCETSDITVENARERSLAALSAAKLLTHTFENYIADLADVAGTSHIQPAKFIAARFLALGNLPVEDRPEALAVQIISGGDIMEAHMVKADSFLNESLRMINQLPPEERGACLDPLVYSVDAAVRKRAFDYEKAMVLMGEIRDFTSDFSDDVSCLSMNAQNIVRGWTPRPEKKEHHEAKKPPAVIIPPKAA